MPSPELQAFEHVVPIMWEWGALVVVLFTLNIIQGFIIRTLYKRNEKQSDMYLAHVKENTAVTTEVRNLLQQVLGVLHAFRPN